MALWPFSSASDAPFADEIVIELPVQPSAPTLAIHGSLILVTFPHESQTVTFEVPNSFLGAPTHIGTDGRVHIKVPHHLHITGVRLVAPNTVKAAPAMRPLSTFEYAMVHATF